MTAPSTSKPGTSSVTVPWRIGRHCTVAGSNRASTGTWRMRATSRSDGATAGAYGRVATTGCSWKPLTGMSSGVSRPCSCTSFVPRAISSRASRSAACSTVSSVSITPPGSDTCPLCRTCAERTVRITCARPSTGNSSSKPAACRADVASMPAGHSPRRCGAISACAGTPGSGARQSRARRSITVRKVTGICPEPTRPRCAGMSRRGRSVQRHRRATGARRGV